MTIPTLMQTTNKKEIVSKVNKALSTINNATKLAEAFNGPVDKWDIDYENTTTVTSEKFAKTIIPYLNVIDECSTEDSSRCMYDGYYKKLNGANHAIYASINTYALVLNDGTVIWFRPSAPTNNYYMTCYVDINGKKGPNQIGVDLFNFILYKNSKTFEAEHVDPTDCNLNGTGWGCAEYILMNGNVNYLNK